MVSRAEQIGWITVALVLVVFAIPWFLWGVDFVVAGLPVWIWYHIVWLFMTAFVFWIFTKRAWGLGIPSGGDPQ